MAILSQISEGSDLTKRILVALILAAVVVSHLEYQKTF